MPGQDYDMALRPQPGLCHCEC